MILKCCGKINPIGVDRGQLCLSFAKNGNREIDSYEIQIASSLAKLREETYDIGSFHGDEQAAYLIWPQPSLFKPRTRYYWQVTMKTEEGIERSGAAYFETGIDSWTAAWIGSSPKGNVSSDEEGIAEEEFIQKEKRAQKENIQNFRKVFQVKGEVEAARLYICGLGYFKAELNGNPLDDTFYKPLVTDYSPRSHPENEHLYENSGCRTVYDTYDVTAYLRKGENVLSVDVAGGYYCNTDKLPLEPDFSYGDPRLVFELYITENGTERRIESDADTMVCSRNRRSTLHKGDCIDFTKADGEYHSSEVIRSPMGRPVSPRCPEDRIEKIILPVKAERMDGGMLYDFGVNHTGGLRITAKAKEGATLHIRYAEVLGEDGRPNYETSAWHDKNEKGRMDIYQENQYILREGKNEIEPLFSWYCYRYVWIKSTGTVRISDLKSLFIHMEAERDGHFACSEESLNRLNEVFLQTLLCNMHSGLVTDCPHREKRPYTGDGSQIMKAALYNLDIYPFYYKWMEDILDAQTPEGLIPNTAPNLGGGGGYAWGNAICFVTKYLYSFTGDRRVAQVGYEAIRKWLSYYETKRDEDYIIRSNSHTWMLGDWLAPDTVVSDVYYISTVCYLMAVDTALFLAGQLESEQRRRRMPESEYLEEQRYREQQYREQQIQLRELKEHIKEGINKIFFHPEIPAYGNGVQGEDVLALAVGVVPEQQRETLCKKVERHYREETDYHLDTGIVLTPILIDYLTDHGYRDIAYRIMTAKTYPSYYSLMENETTLSEHWSGKWPDYYIGGKKSRLVKGGGELSHCHPMYGSVVSWLYERVAGLDLSLLYQRKVQIFPYFTDCLSWAKADKMTPYGKVSVEWEQTEEGLHLQAEIPEGLVGICRLPARKHKGIQNLSTREVYAAQADGFFQFQLPAGTWVLKKELLERRRGWT